MDVSGFKTQFDRIYYALYPITIVIFFGMTAGSVIHRQWMNALESFVFGSLALGVLKINKRYDTVLKRNEDRNRGYDDR